MNILVLSIWTYHSPFQWEREIQYSDEFGQPTESSGFCISDHSVYYCSVLAVIDLGALVYALYEAYLARNLSTEFAESIHIARALMIIMAVSFLGIPIAIIASDHARSKFFALSGIIFTICMSLLLFIFVPKELYRRKSPIGNIMNVVGTNMGREHSPGSGLDHSGLNVVDNRKIQEDLRRKVEVLENKVRELEESQEEVEVGELSQTANKASVELPEPVSQIQSASQERASGNEANVVPTIES